MNKFTAVEGLPENWAILIAKPYEVIFTGPLNAITADKFNRSRLTLVAPATLKWIKDAADEAVKAAADDAVATVTGDPHAGKFTP